MFLLNILFFFDLIFFSFFICLTTKFFMLNDLINIWLAEINSMKNFQQIFQMLDMLDRFSCFFVFVIILSINSIIKIIFVVEIIKTFVRIKNFKINEFMYEIFVFIVLFYFNIVKLVIKLRWINKNFFFFFNKLEQKNIKYVMNSLLRRQNEFVNLFVYFIENFKRFKLLLFKFFIVFCSNVFVSQLNVIVNNIFHKFHTSVSVFFLLNLNVIQNFLKHFDEFAEMYNMLFN